MRVLPLLLAIGLCACPRPAPPPPPPPSPPPVSVPAGCMADLSGRWVHAIDPSYRYRGVDDGGTLVLTAFRAFSEDAGFMPRRFMRVDGGVVVVAPNDAGAAAAYQTARAAGGLADGGETVEPADGGATAGTVVVTRTPGGFVGVTEAEVMLPSGRNCRVKYPTTVVACGDGGLTIRSRSALALGDACQPPANPQPAPDVEHHLVRAGQRIP